jgi:hypothetical protein
MFECLNTWHAKQPGETSGIRASFCILHYPPKSEMTNTLLEVSVILATGGEFE